MTFQEAVRYARKTPGAALWSECSRYKITSSTQYVFVDGCIDGESVDSFMLPTAMGCDYEVVGS